MNLFLFMACNSFGLSAFVVAVVIFMILEIIGNIVLTFLGSWSSAIWALVKIILLVMFFKQGLSVDMINYVLITFLILYGIGSLSVFVDPIGGIIAIILEILNIVGFILFHVYLI